MSEHSGSEATAVGAMTISEFCAKYRISRSTYYNMEEEGKAPRRIKLGRRVIITYAAAKDWERDLEGPE